MEEVKVELVWDVPETATEQFQFGNFENRRGVSIFQECPNFNLGILKTEGGGLYFSKMSQFQLFDSVFCNITFIRNV